jgi:4-hydroxybenzoate polyprenyltransferase
MDRGTPPEHESPGPGSRARALWELLRPHQWLKNLLLFVPLLTAYSFMDGRILVTMAVAFLAFSLVASAAYAWNDVCDLEHDRAHPRKRLRPLASGRLSIAAALATAGGALATGLALAVSVSPAFAGIVLLYLVLTASYSAALKSYVLVDVVLLAVLYTLRIVAGAVAGGIAISSWLLAFALFLFLSLALVKRCSELVSLERTGGTQSRGRDYRRDDLVVLWPLGSASALAAAVVFGLFISAPETQARYATPALLWLVAIGLLYWVARLWLKTSRGEMHDDPLVFALRDRGSRVVIVLMLAATLVARFVSLDVSGLLQ